MPDPTSRTSSRPVFYVSGGTGITAEALGQSLLSQFTGQNVAATTLPYINSAEMAHEAVARIRRAGDDSGVRPLVFSTLVDTEQRQILERCQGLVLDLFASFMAPLEATLGVPSSHKAGQSHAIQDPAAYRIRIDAIHFALDNDDGGRTRNYDQADIILLGVSRSGKTPTCLYLGLQFGIRAANYPLTEEDFNDLRLPQALEPYREKLFGLTMDSSRLSTIRNERMNGSRYASARQCETENLVLQDIYNRYRIPHLDVTELSIEEISTRILAQTGLERRLQG